MFAWSLPGPPSFRLVVEEDRRDRPRLLRRNRPLRRPLALRAQVELETSQGAQRIRHRGWGAIAARAAAPNPLGNLRGLELNLSAESERAPEGAVAPKQARAVTA